MCIFQSSSTESASHLQHLQQLFYSHLIQDNPGEPVLSQRIDLLEQPLDEPDVLPTAQPSTTGKPSGLVVLCFTDMVSAPHV